MVAYFDVAPARSRGVCWAFARSTTGRLPAGHERSRAGPARHRGCDQISNAPGNQNIQTDLWQVSVPIRPRLLAGLDQTDHGHEHADIPKPACDDVGSL